MPVHRVFVSYSRSDRTFVAVAIQLLRAGGASVFYDAVSIEFGDRWEVQLQRAISQCERVLVFWSAAAATSTWVAREWREAAALSKRIVPLQLDQTPMPTELAQFQGITGLLETLREALDSRSPAPPPAAFVPAAPVGPAPSIPEDWDPFAPDSSPIVRAPTVTPPLPIVLSPGGTSPSQDPLSELFGGTGGGGTVGSDPFTDFGLGVPSPEADRGQRFTALLFNSP